MGFLKRLLGRSDEPPTTMQPVTFHSGDLTIPATSFDAHGGQGDSYSKGYALHGPAGGLYGHLSEIMPPRWERAGVKIVYVAGVTKRPDALRSPLFSAGREVALVREPNNRHDRNAVSVWDTRRTVQLGFVPRETAAEIAATADEYRGFVIRESFSKQTHQRVGVKLLLALNLSRHIDKEAAE